MLWNDSGARVLPQLSGGITAGSDLSVALSINASGTVVGYSTAREGYEQAVIWSLTSVQALPRLPGGNSATAEDINDAGSIVGGSEIARDVWRAVRWDGSAVSALAEIPAMRQSYASSVNAQGTIVGLIQYEGEGHNRAALWNRGTVFDLNSLLAPDALGVGWYLESATAINDLGWIGGIAKTLDGTGWSGYVLIPSSVPELPVGALLALGSLIVLARVRYQKGSP